MKITTLIFDYVCSVCWSPLIEDIDQHTAICARYGLDHAGYHRKSGVEWARNHSDSDRQEVIRLYQDVKPFCYQLGLAKVPQPVSVEQLQHNRHALGRDDCGF